MVDRSGFLITDTDYIASARAFDFYREAICRFYMPTTPQPPEEIRRFRVRVVGKLLENGAVSRTACTPHVISRTIHDARNSPEACWYLLYHLSGRIEYRVSGAASQETASEAVCCGPGDIFVADSEIAGRCRMSNEFQDYLVLTIPKSRFHHVSDVHAKLGSGRVLKTQTPLSDCLSLAADCVRLNYLDELSSLYEACVALLTLECNFFKKEDDLTRLRSQNDLLGRVLKHIDKNIGDEELSPSAVAGSFGISVRYIHKLFASIGASFSAYVTARRLDFVHEDLISTNGNVPIAKLAAKWGFQEASTFNRAFKRRFGYSPSEVKARR